MKFWRAMTVGKNLLQCDIYIKSLIMIYRLHCAHIQIIRHYACKIKNQISINAPNLFLLKIPTTNILRSIFLLIEIVCSYHLSLFPNQTENNWWRHLHETFLYDGGQSSLYNFYLALDSMSINYFDYVPANLDEVTISTIHKCGSALSQKNTQFINYYRNMIEDRVVKFLEMAQGGSLSASMA